MDEKESIGMRIAKIRHLADLTQEEFADRIGLTNYKTLAAYENDRRNPSRKVLLRICDEFDVSMDYLVGNMYLDSRSEILYLITRTLESYTYRELECFYKRLRLEKELYHGE